MGLTALKHTTETDVLRKPCGSLHYSENYADYLMIVERKNIEAAVAETVYLSADGCSWTPSWHIGRESDRGSVYVERHDRRGCVFHGWIDPVSRRIVQAG